MIDVKKIIAVILLAITVFSLYSCGSSSTGSSRYQLHDKDGNINWEYYNDMQDYFKKHPEKRP